jgi:replication factor A1
MADRKFSNLKNNYEVTFNNYSEIRLVAGDNDSIKHVQYHFTKIAHLNDAAVNSNVDILCVVKAGSECSEINSQKQGGKILHKRDLTVFDDSGCECRLTLWGDRAREEVNWSADQPILAIKAARVGEYNGKNLSLGAASSLEINPDIPEAHALYRFKISNGTGALTSLSTAGELIDLHAG